MVITSSNEVLPLRPALGQDIKLGQLYDVRSSQFFGGMSLWKNSEVNAVQKTDDIKVQNAEYRFTYSLDEARNDNSLDVEGSLALDLKMFSAEGSAKYLNEKKSSNHEARLNVSCTIERRTRRIPMEVLSNMMYESILDDPQYTHFVAEVVEGASATLTFARSCSSEEEAKEITGELKIKIVPIHVNGSAKVEFKEGSKKLMENVRISYSGALAENVGSLEDAQRVAKEMPSKLATQMNTLKYKLLPLSKLGSKGSRLIRSLDTGLVNKTAEALQYGSNTILALKDVVADEVFQKQFSAIRKQIMNFQAALSMAETDFTTEARQLLPELRDGNTDSNEKIGQLQKAVGLYSRRIEIAQQFVKAKSDEASTLRDTIAVLLAEKFENYLEGLSSGALVDNAGPRLLLSIGGRSIDVSKHPLQSRLESTKSNDPSSNEDDQVYDEEWFEDQKIRALVEQSCDDLRQQRKLVIPGVNVSFGVASINAAFRGKKNVGTGVGDIIMEQSGKLFNVTGMLPKAPRAPKITVTGQTFTVAWSSERKPEEELAIPTIGYAVRYRKVLNPERDGPFPRAHENEMFQEVTYAATDRSGKLENLSDDCDYEVAFRLHTSVGASPWRVAGVERTEKSMSEARSMLDFFDNNKAKLTAKPSSQGDKPWEFDASKKTMFLGNKEFLKRTTNVAGFVDEIAVRIVDVATEYKPKLVVPSLDQMDQTIVAVFTGASGAGKSTQINAFVSYLLGGEVDDLARILLIDDRGLKQSESVTQLVTCFRIRPLAPVFDGKTMLIVDTPGYGDSRGISRDAFVTAAMSEFFGTVSHVNSIIFVCKANEVRTTLLAPVSTYVFSLFAKDVQNCLRTVYTFSDGAKPQAQGALQELKWPVENGEVSVNNSAFTLDVKGSDVDAKTREQWIESVKSQFILQSMLLKMTPVPTKGSAEVTKKRMKLEEKCQLAEKKIKQTATDAQRIIAQLSTLSIAIGAAPDQQVAHSYWKVSQRPVPEGKFTTLCLTCQFTCHEICEYGDDNQKADCIAMTNGKCTMCKDKCPWTAHKNAQWILYSEEITEMITPKELIKKWNETNNTLEGVLIKLLDDYLKQQDTLRMDMRDLADLNDQLNATALLHDSTGLINYVDMLIKTAKTQNAPAEYLIQLNTARNTLQLLSEFKHKNKPVGQDLQILVAVLKDVRSEMDRRMRLTAEDRAAEERKPCSLYNDLRQKLPLDLMEKAPPPLQTESAASKGALYEENLKVVVTLVQLVLKDGGVVAALASQAS